MSIYLERLKSVGLRHPGQARRWERPIWLQHSISTTLSTAMRANGSSMLLSMKPKISLL